MSSASVAYGWCPPGRRHDLPRARRSDDSPVLVDNLAPPDCRPRPAGHVPTRIDGPMRRGQFVLVADRPLQIWIPDDDVGVRADLNRAFARIDAENLRRVRRGDGDELLQ